MRAYHSIDRPESPPIDPESRAAVFNSLVSDLECYCSEMNNSDSAITDGAAKMSDSPRGSEDDVSMEHDVESTDLSGSPVMKLDDVSWPLNLSDWVAYRGGESSKDFFTAAVQVALSLAIKMKMDESVETILHDDIAFSNVIVNEDGDSDFVIKSGADCKSMSTELVVKTQTSKAIHKGVYYLGRLFFELFTRGSALPCNPGRRRSESLSIQSLMDVSDDAFRSLSDSLVGDQDQTINVEAKESYESMIHERLHDSYRKSPFAIKITTCIGGDRGILGLANKQRRASEHEEENSPLTMMQIAGVPSSVCRLINDMLMNTDDEGVGSICKHNQMITSFNDVVEDLQQMCSAPESFISDTLTTRFKPVLCDKMYGRDDDLQLVADIAVSLPETTKQDIIMISGHSGCGKSTLVNELIASLDQNSWGIIHCKFNTLQSGVSAVISAFDQYFLTAHNILQDVQVQRMRDQAVPIFGEASLEFLCGIIPSLRCFMNRSNIIPMNHANAMSVQESLSRLILLLNLMVKLISSEQRPLLLLEDLHWADLVVMDLMTTILEGTEEEVGIGANTKQVFLVGSYRDNEVDCEHPLHVTLQQITKQDQVNMTEIHLHGLSCDAVELIVSDCLMYPRRLIRSLSTLIHQKSTGNPLFIREFLHELSAENLLTYSLASRKWEWDEDTIREKTVSNSVAELLTRRLLRLPDTVLFSLRVMSCFGSKVHQQVLTHVNDTSGPINPSSSNHQLTMDNDSDIFSDLDFALKEGLVEYSKETYKFTHDMIYQAVAEGFDSDEKIDMIQALVKTLLTSAYGMIDNMVFVIVYLVNQVGAANTSDPIDRVQYARLNLSAGVKAINSADFSSALGYINSGISFLHPESWQSDYGLSLSLFEQHAVVNWAQGNLSAMKSSIETVIKNAQCFDDKLNSIHLLVHSLGLDGKSATKAISHGFAVLEYLGEHFSSRIDNPTYIAKELSDLKQRLKEFFPDNMNLPLRIDDFPVMQDRKKLDAMIFLSELSCQFYSRKSPLCHIMNARMVDLSIRYGLCPMSSPAFAMLGLSFTFVLKKVTEGYRLGQIALSLVSSNESFKVLLPEVYYVVYGLLSVWKEPIQVLLHPLLDAYKVSIQSGKFSTAGGTCVIYSYRAFFAGSLLSNLHRDVLGFSRVMYTRNRALISLSLQPILQAVMGLRGIPSQTGTEWSEGGGYEAVLRHLAQLATKNEFALCESIFAVILMNSFIFHKGEDSEQVVRHYLEYFEQHDSTNPDHFVTIYRCLYGGLISFHYYRKTQDTYWLDRGNYTIQKMVAWNRDCQWNFQNKVLLLQAEYNFSIGKISKTQQLYKMSIELSRKHRFVHEEALACELSSAFHTKVKGGLGSDALLRKAYQCYQTWGADEKARCLSLEYGDVLFGD